MKICVRLLCKTPTPICVYWTHAVWLSIKTSYHSLGTIHSSWHFLYAFFLSLSFFSLSLFFFFSFFSFFSLSLYAIECNPPNTLVVRVGYYNPHFLDEETEVQRFEIFPSLHT